MSAKKTTQATLLVELATEMELFHTPEHVPYATFEIDGHKETWALKSGSFKRYLGGLYFKAEGQPPNSQALQDALDVLAGRAEFEGEQLPVHVRLAAHDGAIYIDRGDPGWGVIKVTPSGWKVTSGAPVRFRRPRGMGVLPRPERGGDIEELWEFVNVPEAGRPLLLGVMAAALRPQGPYVILCFFGEQGSTKSTAGRVIRHTIDPAASFEAALRSPPRSERDLMIAASRNWVIGLDNLSEIRDWLSDALCRLATGGSFATRELYENDEEIVFTAERLVLLNAIGRLTTRSDLLDRAVLFEMPNISDEDRRDEGEFKASFELARPRILGALLDAVAYGMANPIKLAAPPRMADFANWAASCLPALGYTSEDFLKAYRGNRSGAHQIALEAELVTEPLRQVAEEGFDGTMTELLHRLEGIASEEITRRHDWPKTAQVLGTRLRTIAPNLRGGGVSIEFEHTRDARQVHIRRTETSPPPEAEDARKSPSQVSQPSPTHAGRDARDSGDNDLHDQSDGHDPGGAEDLRRLGIEPLSQKPGGAE